MDEADIRKNFQQTDALLSVLLAKLKATELALATLIASHPRPDHALAVWDRVRLELSDEAFDAQVFPEYQPQMAKSLAMWSHGFQEAADAQEP